MFERERNICRNN
jgi:hypothetical protein